MGIKFFLTNKPLYKLFVASYPVPSVKYYPKAAQELGVNLSINYHGCFIRSLYKNEDGSNIIDAEVEYEKNLKENLIAENYYKEKIGDDWLIQLENLAYKYYNEVGESNIIDDLPF